MNDPKWVKIFSSSDPVSLHILKAMLEEEKIENLLLDQKDSNYGFGELILFVRDQDQLKALQIVLAFTEQMK